MKKLEPPAAEELPQHSDGIEQQPKEDLQECHDPSTRATSGLSPRAQSQEAMATVPVPLEEVLPEDDGSIESAKDLAQCVGSDYQADTQPKIIMVDGALVAGHQSEAALQADFHEGPPALAEKPAI